MEETLRQKQLYLRENILDKGYSTDNFMDLLHSKKGEQGLDLNNWTMRELALVVKEFISNENSYDNYQENNFYKENKPQIETDEDYEQKCMQKYKEQKQKENQEYGSCTKIKKSNLNMDDDNINIKVILPTQNINKESGEFLIETYPNRYKVRRNLEDFDLILNYLNKKFMNYVVPQLSKKNYGEKYTEEKALKRSRALNKFLEGLIVHPTLKHIDILNDFLSINSEEDFEDIKKKYLSMVNSEENIEEKLSLEDIKSLNGKIKISINKEKEVYFMNIKDNTKINESIMKKINKSYKNLIEIMQTANDKMREISDLWKLLYDKSLKYYETLYSSESYKIMNKMIEELLASETKKINIININIREYFRFMKNEFHMLSDLAAKVENYKDKYYKAFEKLNEDKEKLFKEQDVTSWGLNENDLKHKDVFLKNKELAFSRMMPEESNNVLDTRNIYGAYLNSLIDEYERIRLLNGKKNKENTIKILRLFNDDFKYINNSFENKIAYLNRVKDEEINDNVNEIQNDDDNKNLFNNNKNINNINKQSNNIRQSNNQLNFGNNNNNMMINNRQNNRNNNNQPKRDNNQANFNNKQKQMNININNRMNNQSNRNNNQFDNRINQNNNQQKRKNNDLFDINRNNQYEKNNNNQYNRNNNQQNRNRNNQYDRNNNSNQYDRNNNSNQYDRNNDNIQFDRNNNSGQFDRRNNNYQFDRNNDRNNQNNRNRNNQNDMRSGFNNENNRNTNKDLNNNENDYDNDNKDFFNKNNRNDDKDIYNDDDNFDFNINRNNNINIYEF